MNDIQLRSFLIVTDCGSFSQAEKVLFLSKQALKKQMDALEEELQCTLFIRTPQGIQLTEAGSAFLSTVPKILKEMDNSVALCRQVNQKKHPVRVCVPNHPAPLLAKPTWEFCQKNPDIVVQFQFNSAEALSPPQLISDGVIDIFEASLDLNMSHPLEYTPMVRLPYVCMVPPDHPLAGKGGPISPEALEGTEVFFSRFSWCPELMDALSPYCRISVREEATASELELAYNICYAGGLYISADYCTDYMPPLIPIPLSLPFRREIGLLYSATAPAEVRRYVHGMKALLGNPPVVSE